MPSRTRQDRRIAMTLQALERDLGRPIDMRSLARLVNLSESRLRHLFKEVTGATIAGYVRERRLELAATLLRDTFLRVSEIAFQLSFSTVTHFNRAFHCRFGKSPSEYRCDVRNTRPLPSKPDTDTQI